MRYYLLPRYEDGLAPDYAQLAELERARQWNIAKAYMQNPSLPNIFNAIGAAWNALPFNTTPESVNPYLQYGDAPSVGLNPKSAVNAIKKGMKNLGRMRNMQSYDDYIREAEKYGSNFWWNRPGMAEDPNIINQMNKREEMLGNVWKALKKKELIEDLGGVGAVGYGAYKQYKKNYKSGKLPKLKSRTIR